MNKTKLQRITSSYHSRNCHTFLKRSSIWSTSFQNFIYNLHKIILYLVLLLAIDTIAFAQNIQFRKSVLLGTPARPVTISLSSNKDEVTLHANSVASLLPIRGVTDFTVEPIKIAPNRQAAIVSIKGSHGNAAAIVTRFRNQKPKILWTGRTDSHGDLGESRRDVIEIRKQQDSEFPQIVVGHYQQGIQICGSSETLLSPRFLDPTSLSLRSVAHLRASDHEKHVTQTITATRQAPKAQTPPLLKALRFSAASSNFGYSEISSDLPPHALTDGKTTTAWIENQGSGGRGEFVTAQWKGSKWPIRALSFVFSSKNTNKAGQTASPKEFLLVGDDQKYLRVIIPEDPIAHPDERYFIIPENPLSWRCLSIVLVQAYLPERDQKAHTSIYEVEAYTDLDFGNGVKTLVEQLVRDSQDAPEATQLLSQLGSEAVQPLVKSWNQMSPRGRRRAVRVFAASAQRSQQARQALAQAISDTDESVSSDALKALVKAGKQSFIELSDLVAVRSPQSDNVALAIAKLSPIESIPVLLNAIKVKGGTERPVLRNALFNAVKHSGERGLQQIQTQVQSWPRKPASDSALATVILAISPLPTAHNFSTSNLIKLIKKTDNFPDLWRLVAASKNLPAHDDIDAWLGNIIESDERWMLREAALQSLKERNPINIRDYINSALADEYPRVRATGLALLGDDGKTVDILSNAALKDAWPMVRAAAASALSSHPNAAQTLISCIDDTAKIVRSNAIQSLITLEERSAWRKVKERLFDEQEWPRVTRQAIIFAKQFCIKDAASALEKLVYRALKPNPWQPDIEVAASALDALVVIMGKEAESTVQSASSPVAPPQLRIAAEQVVKHAKKCVPR